MNNQHQATAVVDRPNQVLRCAGEWTLAGVNDVARQVAMLSKSATATLTITGNDITHLDSAGAWILCQLVNAISHQGKKTQLSGFSEEYQALLHLVQAEAEKASIPQETHYKLPWVARLGKSTVIGFREGVEFLSFFGELVITALNTLRRPRHIQWRSFLNVIDQTGYQALPIVGLLCFLIGVVLAYQMGQQLKTYGANVYIISLLGVGVLQEFAPLITAIVVASRTSSAFTAQIGTMLINEEVDALRTMGLSPVNRLVLPKVFALLISLPLLVIWADIFGILGGMIIAKRMLGITYYNFLSQFPQVIHLSTFINGFIKMPVFAAIISGVGCFQGFRVSSNADSIGLQTTKSVVQAIFLIIVADAIFSIILPWQNI